MRSEDDERPSIDSPDGSEDQNHTDLLSTRTVILDDAIQSSLSKLRSLETAVLGLSNSISARVFNDLGPAGSLATRSALIEASERMSGVLSEVTATQLQTSGSAGAAVPPILGLAGGAGLGESLKNVEVYAQALQTRFSSIDIGSAVPVRFDTFQSLSATLDNVISSTTLEPHVIEFNPPPVFAGSAEVELPSLSSNSAALARQPSDDPGALANTTSTGAWLNPDRVISLAGLILSLMVFITARQQLDNSAIEELLREQIDATDAIAEQMRDIERDLGGPIPTISHAEPLAAKRSAPVRAGPRAAAPEVARLRSGDRVLGISQDGTWIFVLLGRGIDGVPEYGWVNKRHLLPSRRAN